MSDDLERLFAALAQDADGAPLPGPDAARRRGNRRRRDWFNVVCAVVAILLMVATIALYRLTAEDREPAGPTPGPTSLRSLTTIDER